MLWIHSVASDVGDKPPEMTTFSADEAWLMHCKGMSVSVQGRVRKCGVATADEEDSDSAELAQPPASPVRTTGFVFQAQTRLRWVS
jgi:hypothetical protein